MTKNRKSCVLQPGEWVRGKIVGSGSFGSVYMSMNKSTGALFVVKSTESEAGIESLKHEAKILEKLNSPHIVQYLGSDLKKKKKGRKECNLFFEYMAGGSLSDIAEKFGGVIDENVIRLYTREILLGLKYLHENGIVHCDIKCKNVLLGLNGNVKLADFGCGQRVKSDFKKKRGSKNSLHSIVGTPLWMAPEVLRNEKIEYSADIWSLGCTVIEMATGRPPWGDLVENPMAAVMKIAKGDEKPQFPDKLSKEGFDFLEKCLERDPKKRWRSEELLFHPFVWGEKEEGSGSPASVFGLGNCEQGYESDDLVDRSELKRRIKLCQTSPWKEKMEISSWENEQELWITVRSL